MLEEEKQCSKNYSQMGAPVIATEPGYDTGFFWLSGRVWQQRPEDQQWEEITSALPGGHVLLGQQSDEVFTWRSNWSLVMGLGAEEQLLVPAGAKEGQGGFYQRSVLGQGPFRFQDVELTRQQLLNILAQSKPYFVGVVYTLDEADQVSIHQTGGEFTEWCSVYFRGATPILQRMSDSLAVTLYRVIEAESRDGAIVSPELYVGYQRLGTEEDPDKKVLEGPELLLKLDKVLDSITRCWSPGELRATLTKSERYYLPSYFGLGSKPKAKKNKSHR